MSMKFTQLKTHWCAEQAYTVIEFLDQLREMLWIVYGEEIIRMQEAVCRPNTSEISTEGECRLKADEDF